MKGQFLSARGLIFVDLRINGAQFQSQTVNDNTSSRTQQIEIELWSVER